MPFFRLANDFKNVTHEVPVELPGKTLMVPPGVIVEADGIWREWVPGLLTELREDVVATLAGRGVKVLRLPVEVAHIPVSEVEGVEPAVEAAVEAVPAPEVPAEVEAAPIEVVLVEAPTEAPVAAAVDVAAPVAEAALEPVADAPVAVAVVEPVEGDVVPAGGEPRRRRKV